MVHKVPFGKTQHGEQVDAYMLENENRFAATVMTYGAAITSIIAPDRHGELADVVLGFDSLAGYERADNPYFGATCGRYANRIHLSRFTLEGRVFHLAANDGLNSLHGGTTGFDKVVWNAVAEDDAVRMWRTSPDGEEGYPGNLQVKVRFTLDGENALCIDYTATTDRTTVLNLTNHSYFNLAGSGTIRNHLIRIHADRYTVVDDDAIPSGERRGVSGSEMDLWTPVAIGARIDEVQGMGYDHNYCLNSSNGSLAVAAEVADPGSGRTLTCLTTEPGIHFYTGNFLDGVPGKAGALYGKQEGFCLETQHFPDSPNKPDFPSTVLHPEKTYTQTCIYAFGVVE